DQHQPVAMEHAGQHLVGGEPFRQRRLGLFRHHDETAITAPDMNDSANQNPKPSWWQRLSTGLKRTSASIGGAIADIVAKRKLDAGTIEDPEEVLIRPA